MGSKGWLRDQLSFAEMQIAQLNSELASLRPVAGSSEQTVEHAVGAAREATRTAAEAAKGTDGSTADAQWSVALWLESLGSPSRTIAEALLVPLHDASLSTEGTPNEPAELAFIKQIGRQDAVEGPEAMLRLLQRGGLLSKLSQELYRSANKLAGAGAVSVTEMQSKFHDEAGFTLQFGGMDTFYGGLERLLGPPSPNLLEAMRRDHCASRDSFVYFNSANYDVHTTSQIEWLFVVDPEGGLGKLHGVDSWPVENRLLKAHAELKAKRAQKARESRAAGVNASSEAPPEEGAAGGARTSRTSRRSARTSSVSADGGDDDLVDPEDADPASRMREPLSRQFFEPDWAVIDERLEALDIDLLQEVEFFGARLYTGPLYVKYNAVLRGVESNEFMERRFNSLCLGNRYTTTLHVINSAVVKLAKLQPAVKVYRGVAGGKLPPQFLAPDENNVCGGCEYGFLSTTTDVRVAAEYASSGKVGMVFELAMGMVDRGADLSWLSQYPHECEILFAPLTGLEVRASRVEASLLMLEVRLSVNLTNKPIEEVVAKMQSSTLGLIDLMRDDFKYHGAPKAALEPLESYYLLVDNQDPEFYNASENYQTAVAEALEAKRKVLHLLTNGALWQADAPVAGLSFSHTKEAGAPPPGPVHGTSTANAVDDTFSSLLRADGADGSSGSLALLGQPGSAHEKALARRQFACAALAAREGEHSDAVDLLKMTVAAVDPGSAAQVAEVLGSPKVRAMIAEHGDADLERWRLDAAYLLSEGCMEPWPATFVTIATKGGPVVQCACAVMAVAMLPLSSRTVGDAVVAHHDDEETWRRGVITALVLSDGERVSSADGAPAAGAPGASVEDIEVKVGIVTVSAKPSRVLVPSVSSIFSILSCAAASGSAELVRDLLELGVGIYESNASGDTALLAAARNDRLEVCRVLVDAGADPFLDNARQESAFEAAVRSEARHCRRLFHPEEADIDLTAALTFLDQAGVQGNGGGGGDDAPSEAVLQLLTAAAAREGDEGHALTMMEKALESGERDDAAFANSVCGESGVSALMLAASRGHSTCCRWLLEKGADVDAQSRNGASATLMAAENGCEEAVDVLCKVGRANVTLCTKKGKTALHEAARYGHARVVAQLMENGADLLRLTSDGRTSVFLAAQSGHVAVIKLILESFDKDDSADGRQRKKRFVDAANALNGRTALMNAAMYGHTEATEMLLDAGADAEKKDSDGETALTLACADGHEQTARTLLSRGADINAPGYKGCTPLMAACYYGHQAVARALLTLGAKVDAVDEGGSTALMRVCGYEQEDDWGIFDILVKAGAPIGKARSSDGSTALHIAAEAPHDDATTFLLKAGADPNVRRKDGHTPLTIAAQNGFESILGLLVDSNVGTVGDVNMATTAGYTALHYAAERGDVVIVRRLLGLGAKADAKTKAGATPSDLAATGKTPAHMQVAARLTEAMRGNKSMRTTKRRRASAVGSVHFSGSPLRSTGNLLGGR